MLLVFSPCYMNYYIIINYYYYCYHYLPEVINS